MPKQTDSDPTEEVEFRRKCEVGEAYDKPVLTFDPDGRYPFSLGAAKLKKVIQCVPEIEEFIRSGTIPT